MSDESLRLQNMISYSYNTKQNFFFTHASVFRTKLEFPINSSKSAKNNIEVTRNPFHLLNHLCMLIYGRVDNF